MLRKITIQRVLFIIALLSGLEQSSVQAASSFDVYSAALQSCSHVLGQASEVDSDVRIGDAKGESFGNADAKDDQTDRTRSTFVGQSRGDGFGGGLAVPIEGVPVGVNLHRSHDRSDYKGSSEGDAARHFRSHNHYRQASSDSQIQIRNALREVSPEARAAFLRCLSDVLSEHRARMEAEDARGFQRFILDLAAQREQNAFRHVQVMQQTRTEETVARWREQGETVRSGRRNRTDFEIARLHVQQVREQESAQTERQRLMLEQQERSDLGETRRANISSYQATRLASLQTTGQLAVVREQEATKRMEAQLNLAASQTEEETKREHSRDQLRGDALSAFIQISTSLPADQAISVLNGALQQLGLVPPILSQQPLRVPQPAQRPRARFEDENFGGNESLQTEVESHRADPNLLSAHECEEDESDSFFVRADGAYR